MKGGGGGGERGGAMIANKHKMEFYSIQKNKKKKHQ